MDFLHAAVLFHAARVYIMMRWGISRRKLRARLEEYVIRGGIQCCHILAPTAVFVTVSPGAHFCELAP